MANPEGQSLKTVKSLAGPDGEEICFQLVVTVFISLSSHWCPLSVSSA